MKTERLEKPKSETKETGTVSGALPSAATTAPGSRMFVAIGRVRPDPEQPRKVFDPEKVKALADSIREQGILQDLIVQLRPGVKLMEPDLVTKQWRVLEGEKKGLLFAGEEKQARAFCAGKLEDYYELVDGERRWRAAQLAGCKMVPVAVRSVDAQDKLALQVVVNQQHENLSALEEAEAYRRELEGDGAHGVTRPTADQLIKKLGISKGTFYGRLSLTRLTPAVRGSLVEGKISVSVAGLVAAVPGEAAQNAIVLEACGGKWGHNPLSFREVQKLIEEKYLRQLKGAPFDQEAAYKLTPGMVPDPNPEHKGLCVGCQACPHRSGNMAAEFPELAKRPNVCTNVECFERKWEAAVAIQVAAAKKNGKKVIEKGEAKKLFSDYGEHDLHSNSGYVDLSARCEALGWEYKNHWKAALKEKCPEVVLAVAPNGELRELVKADAAREGLKAAGHKLERDGSGSPENAKYKQEQKKRQEGEKKRRYEFNAILTAVVAKAEGVNELGAAWLWNAVSERLMDLSGFYTMQPIEKRRGWKPEKGNYGTCHETEFAKLTLGQRVGLAVEIATSTNEDTLNAVAKELKVDVEAIGKAARAEWKANGNKPPKPGPTPTTEADFEHKWTKTDLFSGANTNYQCDKCGMKGVRYGFDWPPRTKGKSGKCKVAGEGNETLANDKVSVGKAEIAQKETKTTKQTGPAKGPSRTGQTPNAESKTKRQTKTAKVKGGKKK